MMAAGVCRGVRSLASLRVAPRRSTTLLSTTTTTTTPSIFLHHSLSSHTCLTSSTLTQRWGGVLGRKCVGARMLSQNSITPSPPSPSPSSSPSPLNTATEEE
ncbi:hypothetical protein Pcinc_043559 [Petrolisthes cinctipes]|uniref:Uncharacterized protein n=1 Tax=Petrolisthes cinctipes TaxID=88211 RepID=A0AAE1BHG0_PETCI|nr:hypothetical protein Pcinc_043559 [Petrolisthes cinctipes]